MVEGAWRLALGRPPTASEKAEGVQLISRLSLEKFCLSVFNLSEFAFVRLRGPMQCNLQSNASSRRDFLSKFAFGFGGIALDQLRAAAINPLAPKAAHIPAKAKRVIYLFMQGGPSHVDTFDPKPLLQKYDGQTMPASFNAEGINLQFIRVAESKLMGSQRTFRKYRAVRTRNFRLVRTNREARR